MQRAAGLGVSGFLTSLLLTQTFQGDSWWEITLRTVGICALAVGLAFLLGLPLGWWLGHDRSWRGALARGVARVGMAMPPVVLGVVLLLLLARRGPFGDFGWLFTWKAMVLAQFLLVLPFPVAMISEALLRLGDDFEKQLMGLGASRRQLAWYTLRELRPALTLALGASIGRSVSEVGAVLIVGGNLLGQTRVLSTAIVAHTGQGDYRTALIFGMTLLVLAALANAFVVLMARGRLGP